MRKMIYGGLFLALVGIGVVGCKKENERIDILNDSNNHYIEQKNMSTDPTSNLELQVLVDSPDDLESIENVYGWVIATLWRKHPGCTKLGICEWFPNNQNLTPNDLTGRRVSFPIIYDSVNNQFEEVKIAFTSSPLFLSDEDIKFYIDEDFIISIESLWELPYTELMIRQSVLEYDTLIGEHGGYRINIIGRN